MLSRSQFWSIEHQIRKEFFSLFRANRAQSIKLSYRSNHVHTPICSSLASVKTLPVTWDMKERAFMFILILFLAFTIFAGGVQALFLRSVQRSPVRFMPIAVTVAGLLSCVAACMCWLGTDSSGADEEAQALLLFLGLLLGGAFIGCAASILFDVRKK